MRFDKFIAEHFGISRNKASELISTQKVLLDAKICDKPSYEYTSGEVSLLAEIYVGRGALKLKFLLDNLGLDVAGKTALDIGSSTGGFMQILLAKGVHSVVGVDIGSNQLDESLRSDKRVKFYENTDIRSFKSEHKFELITCDVSFISVCEILSAIDKNADKNATIIILFKPQFEVGKDAKRNKKGVVMDKKATSLAMKRFEGRVGELGWILRSVSECEIKGKEGNAEFFYTFNKA